MPQWQFKLLEFTIREQLSIDKDEYVPGKDNRKFIIQMYGLNSEGKTASIFVRGYNPFFYILVGDDWESYSIKSLPSNFNISYVKDLYKGNICLDFGSAEGSSSLYSRSNQIIESGGLILQSRQCDYKSVWENIDKQILFDNFTNLENLINKLLTDNYLSNKILRNISKKFENSKKLIEANLDYIFKKT